MLIVVGVSCRISFSIVSYLYVCFSGLMTSPGEEKELIFLLSFTCNYMVSVQRGFFFLLMLGMGFVFLL